MMKVNVQQTAREVFGQLQFGLAGAAACGGLEA